MCEAAGGAGQSGACVPPLQEWPLVNGSSELYDFPVSEVKPEAGILMENFLLSTSSIFGMGQAKSAWGADVACPFVTSVFFLFFFF